MRLLAVLAALLLIPGLAAPAAAQKQKAAASAAQVKPKARPTAKRWVDIVVRTPEGGYRQGNPAARVKLVEYGSRTCPTCAAFAEEGVGPLRAKYIATGKVSYEFRDFMVHGAPDAAAALLNQCVPVQRFFPLLDAFFAEQPEAVARMHKLGDDRERFGALVTLPQAEMMGGFADALGYPEFVRKHGLDEAKARACLGDAALLSGIEAAHDAGEAMGVHSTPSFLINGTLVEPHGWDALEPLLIAAIG